MIRIMLIEDEPPTLRTLKILLEKLSPQYNIVATASDGEQAVEILRVTPVDVVFTDIRMPIEDGFYVLDYLTKHSPDTLNIILSGYSEFAYAKKALSYNVVDYLLKPISTNELKIIMEKIEELYALKKKASLKEDIQHTDLSYASTDQIMFDLENYLKTHIEEPITHQSLAEMYGFSAAYLSKLFKKYRGITPTEYLTSLRIEKAKLLLESEPSLLTKNVASLTGFTDPYYFSKIFKKTVGLTPKEYKKQYAKS